MYLFEVENIQSEEFSRVTFQYSLIKPQVIHHQRGLASIDRTFMFAPTKEKVH